MALKDWSELAKLKPEPFSVRPRYSKEGDCLFMYLAEDESRADRVDDYLTIYRAFDKERVVGFKLKNVRFLVDRIGAFGVNFSTREFDVTLLFQSSLGERLKSPDFDPETLPPTVRLCWRVAG